MKIRKAKTSEIKEIKQLIDSFEEMDTSRETFPESYFKRILKNHILLVAENEEGLIGCCFGSCNSEEQWADLLGLVVKKAYRKKGTGKELVQEFEKLAKENNAKTIDLFADKKQVKLFRKMGYKPGNHYISFRKTL